MTVGQVKDLVLSFLGQFEANSWHPSLGKAVAGLDAAKAKWTPEPGQHSIWEHVNHVIAWDLELASRLAGNPPRQQLYERVEAGWPGPTGSGSDADWADTIARLAEAHGRLVQAAQSRDDEGLTHLNGNGKTSVAARLVGCVDHETYHLAQVILLRRMQGAWTPEW